MNRDVKQRLEELERDESERRVALVTYVCGKVNRQWVTASQLKHLGAADREKLLSEDRIEIRTAYGGKKGQDSDKDDLAA